MDMRTGEIVSAQALLGKPKAEQSNFVSLKGLQPHEIEKLRDMAPLDRLIFVRKNSERILAGYGRNEQKRVLAASALGLTRKQLQAQGIKIRPKTIKRRAAGRF